MGEIAGVTKIDGRPIGDGLVGPVTAELARVYQAYARANGVLVVTLA
jgi:branched-chain amino acid aminotransferase